MSSIPPATREDVMTAVFNLLQPLSPTPFKLLTRKLQLWDTVPAEQQPSLMMAEHEEHALPAPRGLPPKREWKIKLFIYAKAGEPVVGAILLNNLLDAVDSVLQVSGPTNILTLGGIVYRAWIDGPILKDPGDLEGQAAAIYPISIRPP